MPAKKTVSTAETTKAAVNTEEATKETTVKKTTAKKTTTKAAPKKATAKKAMCAYTIRIFLSDPARTRSSR